MMKLTLRALLVAAVATASACSDDTTNDNFCNASTCTGCCDATGACQPWSAANCGLTGTAGEACVACLSGQTCNAGVCQSGCDASNCNGCCDQFGNCADGIAALQCGQGGEACQTCGPTEQCVAQSCTPVVCGPDTCSDGCCDASGACRRPGTTESACGQNGGSCQQCSGTDVCIDHTCQPATGTCECPNGCCDESGQCVDPPTDAACGKNGDACVNCGGNRECVAGECKCTTSSCSGCCDGDDCKPGTEKTACGKDGAACQQCTGDDVCAAGSCTSGCGAATCPGCCEGDSCNFGGATDASACGTGGAECTDCGDQVCEGGTCVDPAQCNPQSCGDGCCKGTSCEQGTSSLACGTGGAACQSCPSHTNCINHKCTVKPTSTWRVILQNIEFEDGACGWGDDCDSYVELTVGTETATSSQKNGTNTPLFNEHLLDATAAELTSIIKYVIWDDDTWPNPNDKVLECDTSFNSDQLLAGEADLRSCPSDPQNTNVKSIVWRFELISP